MPNVQHFFVGTRLLGVRDRAPIIRGGLAIAPLSYAFFCDTCGEIWARCPVTVGAEVREWMLWHCPCQRHTDKRRNAVSGSLMLSTEREFNEAVLDVATEYEFQQHLQWMEKQ